jgi:hypothetical protein
MQKIPPGLTSWMVVGYISGDGWGTYMRKQGMVHESSRSISCLLDQLPMCGGRTTDAGKHEQEAL